ncbi:MAG: biliverdin-producing heme oxygenase [Phycisphaerales bacterium]|nr:biliverdin-producing heme oxygenase [Phycisphaerales bacterium]
MDTAQTGTMELLKSSTWELHQAVEGHEFQQSLVKGVLARDRYVRFLGQMLLIHTALEKHLRNTSARWPFCQVIHNRLYREQLLLSDLDSFGVDGRRIHAADATRSLIAEIDRLGDGNSVALLGVLYVLEGSTNGGKWIAKAARKAYNLDEAGATYFDPYGDQQRIEWRSFKQRVDAIDLTDALKEGVVAAAREMFAALSRICDELHHEPTPASSNERTEAVAPARRCPFAHGPL